MRTDILVQKGLCEGLTKVRDGEVPGCQNHQSRSQRGAEVSHDSLGEASSTYLARLDNLDILCGPVTRSLHVFKGVDNVHTFEHMTEDDL